MDHDTTVKLRPAVPAELSHAWQSGPGEIEWPSLRAFGPVDVLKVTIAVRRRGLRLVAQRWSNPDGSSLLELSTRVQPHDLRKQSVGFWAFLTELGFEVAGRRQKRRARSLRSRA